MHDVEDKASSARRPVASRAAPARGPARAVLVRLAVVVVLFAVAGGGIWLAARASQAEVSPTTTEIPALEVQAVPVQPGSIAPVNATIVGAPQQPLPQYSGASQPQGKPSGDVLAGWANRVAPVVGIPARALVAYGNAELAMRAMQPGCHISWATLAGIGRIESNHGQYGGAVLQPDGKPSKPIIGVPLDGSPGVAAIPDTDGGRFDGDPVYDRAVGPMQFIPSTWMKYGVDRNGHLGDPQQIDDAALAAGRYLCAGGRNMSIAQGWWTGILSYNASVQYAQKVFGLADGYAKAAQAVKAG
jgi:membrane-bound lytic murein transglycosylase B